MVRKLLHILFLPCSEATLLMEKRNAGVISSKENRRLSMHLRICKWCRAYKEKLEILDEVLKRKFSFKENVEIKDSEIQDFKNRMFKNLDF